MNDLIRELMEYVDKIIGHRQDGSATIKAQAVNKGAEIVAINVKEILSRYVEDEKWSKDRCGHYRKRCAMDNKDCDGKCGEHASRKLSTPPTEQESLSVDSIGCCPKCGVLLKDMTHEPLSVLLIRHAGGNAGFHVHEWVQEDNSVKWVIESAGLRFFARTYAEAESKARAALEAAKNMEEGK